MFKIVGRLRGKATHFRKKYTNNKKPSYLQDNLSYADFSVGAWSYGKPKVIDFGEGADFRVGRFCSIGVGVTILLGGEHRVDWITTYPFSVAFEDAKNYSGHPKTKGDVIIGNDVWIGQDAFILSGVTIGDGAVVGARSLVAHDVEPYSIVAGNPAKLIRYRFDESIIAQLLKIAWWNWPHSKIVEAFPFLLSSNVEEFISKYRRDI
jgi:acetyltransferase-like isoleucine patch superfamily enzyme